jgi:DNA-binding GntR family transcriptional regulator
VEHKAVLDAILRGNADQASEARLRQANLAASDLEMILYPSPKIRF